MRDMRNYFNLIAFIAFLKVVWDYQLWGQMQKRQHLNASLKYKTATEKRVKKSMARVDMKARVMKESKVKLSHCPKNLSQTVKKVLNIQM